jgi:hypothetical protein
MGNIVRKLREAERKKAQEQKRGKKGKASRQSVPGTKTPGRQGAGEKKAESGSGCRTSVTLRVAQWTPHQ